ncbi:MAG: hypothetical protein NT169_26125 [Chloroflexi bacterium]|nr:hypothetical protein [Chloroflexota bacterium]
MAHPAEDLTPAAQDLLERSVAWMDRYWDAERGLLWGMGDAPDPQGSGHVPYHIVRESAWYALGLLMRDGEGDAGRAVQALEAILPNQFDEPGKVYHGTFYRAPEEPHPPEPAIEWRHYDPNWREFIITTIAVILSEYEDRLPPALVAQIDGAIRKTVEGALARPLSAGYTNIALMNAQMLIYAGDRLGERAWGERGEAMGREVYRRFKLHDAFGEYNSPTYYGPDIYALGLWQAYCSSPRLQQMGAEMEAVLWRDIAQFYHAGLRNLAGPYDRAYGMDMRHYVALLGEWIWLVTGRENAAFPDVNSRFAHAADFCFGPLVAILGLRVPPEVIPHLLAFRGEHCVKRVIGDSPRRTATAWLGERAMIGAEHTSLADIGQSQFHPATIHWQTGAGQVGWIRLMYTGPVDAAASPRRLVITGSAQLAFLIHAPGIQAALVKPEYWRLPGLEVRVEASAPGVIETAGEQVLVRYAGEAGQEVRIALDLSQ